MAHSSRDTAEGAGWGDHRPGEYKRLMPSRVEKLSWLDPRTLWPARNGVLASWFGDPTGRTRARWVEQRAAARAPADAVIRRTDADHFSFMVIGVFAQTFAGESEWRAQSEVGSANAHSSQTAARRIAGLRTNGG